jgi:N-methylhydantoinase B
MAKSSIDPITLEVIRHGDRFDPDQIDANISRTAFSPYIYEYKDFAVGLVSAEGELIAQCTGGMPVFVADSVGMAVRDWPFRLRARAAGSRRRGRMQSRGDPGPAFE